MAKPVGGITDELSAAEIFWHLRLQSRPEFIDEHRGIYQLDQWCYVQWALWPPREDT